MRRLGRQVIIERNATATAAVAEGPSAPSGAVPPVLTDEATEGTAPFVAAPHPPRLTVEERRLFVFRRGRRRADIPRPEFCLNCGLHVPAHHLYCGGCGQENTPSAVSFGELVREAIQEFVRIDSKLVKTLVPLLFKPGLLTQEYVAGKRLRYLSPFKMYVTVSAAFILFFGILIPTERLNDSAQKANVSPNSGSKAGANKALTKPTKDAKGAKGKVKEEGPTGFNIGVMFEEPVDLFGRRFDPKTLPASITEYQEAQKRLPPRKRDGAFIRLLTEKVIRINKNPGDTVRDLLCSTLPLAMLFLIPGYALLLKFFYLRSRRLYVEHLVFTLHAHTFLFLVAAPLLLTDYAGRYFSVPPFLVLEKNPGLLFALLGLFGLYNLLALRRVYRQSLLKTLVKGFLLYHGYLILVAVSLGFGALVATLWTLLSP